MKKISVICVTHKRPLLLEECIYSVIQQSYENWEMVIINDCVDQTLKIHHPKINVYNLDFSFDSIGEKRNYGINKASGDLCIFLDDTDLIRPRYLENIINKIQSSTTLHGQKFLVYENGKISFNNNFDQSTIVFSRDGVEFDVDGSFDGFFNKKRQDGSTKFGYIKNDQVGYIKRNMDGDYGSSLVGEIMLSPHWNEDYEKLIIENILFPEFSKKNISGHISPQILESLVSQNAPKSRWEKVKTTWKKAESFISAAASRGITSTIKDALYIDSESGERVSEEIYKTRKFSCFGNPELKIPACIMLKKHVEDGFFCGACGCGKNKLARLDGEGYTKLHYPHLECPLERRGFSNDKDKQYMIVSPDKPPISVIIPVLNDNEEVNLTIQSIYETSPSNIQIIVIDDASDVPVTLKDSRVILKRIPQRIGAGQARHFGATLATSDHILFTDSHMRFDENWFNNAMERVSKNPTTLWCGVCAGLSEGNMDLKRHKGAYTGADFVLYATKHNTVFDGVWRKEIKDKDDYEISCVMGACYFMHKNWYFHIKGLQQTIMWGSEEPILSLKTWLAGGDVRLMKSVRLGHKFRGTAPYSTHVSHIYYNKLAYMYMLLPDDMYTTLKNKLPAGRPRDDAEEFVRNNKEELDKEKEYYKSIFTRDIDWFMDKFDIKYEC